MANNSSHKEQNALFGPPSCSGRRLQKEQPMKKCILPLALLGLSAVTSHAALANTQVMMLGTGTPVPDGERAGSGIAIIHDDEAYVFDIGPGVVERATQAAERFDIEPLNPTDRKSTRLNSSHVAISYAVFCLK